MYFRANCSTRLPLLPVTRPKDPLVGFEFAPPQFGWLRTLYISKRNCRTWRSQVGKFLRIAPSSYRAPGWRSDLRGWKPNVPASATQRAALLTQPAESVKEPTAIF